MENQETNDKKRQNQEDVYLCSELQIPSCN